MFNDFIRYLSVVSMLLMLIKQKLLLLLSVVLKKSVFYSFLVCTSLPEGVIKSCITITKWLMGNRGRAHENKKTTFVCWCVSRQVSSSELCDSWNMNIIKMEWEVATETKAYFRVYDSQNYHTKHKWRKAYKFKVKGRPQEKSIEFSLVFANSAMTLSMIIYFIIRKITGTEENFAPRTDHQPWLKIHCTFGLKLKRTWIYVHE